MSYHHIDTSREDEPHALPDVEIWQDETWDVECNRGCGVFKQAGQVVEAQAPDVYCPSCEYHSASATKTDRLTWWYQYGFPECMPGGDLTGPFETEAEALKAAREDAGMED